MAFTEQFTDFFNSSEFAVVATYNGATSVNVIFDHEYTEMFGAAGNNPFVTAAASDFASNPRGLPLVIESVAYTIQNIEPDGTGIVRLQLSKD